MNAVKGIKHSPFSSRSFENTSATRKQLLGFPQQRFLEPQVILQHVSSNSILQQHFGLRWCKVHTNTSALSFRRLTCTWDLYVSSLGSTTSSAYSKSVSIVPERTFLHMDTAISKDISFAKLKRNREGNYEEHNFSGWTRWIFTVSEDLSSVVRIQRLERNRIYVGDFAVHILLSRTPLSDKNKQIMCSPQFHAEKYSQTTTSGFCGPL